MDPGLRRDDKSELLDPKIMNEFATIDDKLKRLHAFRPINSKVMESILEDLRLRYTYNSNAIEGNTLSISETKAVIEKGITIKGKSLTEHLEAINHHKAIDMLINFVQNQQELNLQMILDFHGIIMKSVDDEWAGRFRNGRVLISGAQNKPTEPNLIYAEMQQLADYIESSQDVHPITRAARIHLDFVKIHPFFDGNGRTARLIMNLVLMQAQYPITVIDKEIRANYCDAIEEYCLDGNDSAFTVIIKNAVENSLDTYLNVLE